MNNKWLSDNNNRFPHRKLAHVAKLKARIGWQNLRSDEFVDDGPYCITGTDFLKGRINWKTAYHVTKDRYRIDANIQLQENDLLVTKDGTIGKVAVVRGMPGPATLNSGVFVVRAREEGFYSPFLEWVIQSKVFTDFVEFHSGGSTINHLYQNVFDQFRFPYPTHKTQKAIAEFLDREIAHIDQLIDKKQRLIALLREKERAEIHRAVTRGVQTTPVGKESNVPWFGEIPTNWNMKPLRHVAFFQRGHDLPADDREDGPVPLVTSGGLTATHSVSIAKGPGIVTGRYGTIGSFYLINEDYWPLNTTLYTRKIYELPKFVWYLLRDIAHLFILNSSKSAVPGVDRNDIHSERVPVPPKEEQALIADYLDSVNRHLISNVTSIEKSITLLAELRSALITAAVTGQIDVETWRRGGNTDRRLDVIQKDLAS